MAGTEVVSSTDSFALEAHRLERLLLGDVVDLCARLDAMRGRRAEEVLDK